MDRKIQPFCLTKAGVHQLGGPSPSRFTPVLSGQWQSVTTTFGFLIFRNLTGRSEMTGPPISAARFSAIC